MAESGSAMKHLVNTTIALHPFYPLEAEIADYIANDKGALELVAGFLGGWAAILYATWWSASRHLPHLGKLDRTVLLWFVLCKCASFSEVCRNSKADTQLPAGTIHLFFEGYFAINHVRMAPAQDLFGQLWKEYAKSDSRYLTADPFVLCMETLTAVGARPAPGYNRSLLINVLQFCWGPLSYAMAYFIAAGHPLRYPVQAIISLGQIYGDILYYATSMFDFYCNDLTYFRPEPYYFWFYFFMNFIWIVIPGCKHSTGAQWSKPTNECRSPIPESFQVSRGISSS